MTRSIHSTRRHYHMDKQTDFSDEDIKSSRLDKLSEELYKKRTLKQRKLVSRRLAKTAFEATASFDPSTVPVSMNDASTCIHYPASREDLMGVAARLPCLCPGCAL
jgi:hypothetical protein